MSATPGPIALACRFDAQEWAEWRPALAAALPGDTLVRAGDPDHDPATVEIAIVANPPAGALQRYPRLRLVQSLWAGVDKLLADPTLPADLPIVRMVDPAMNAAMAETALWAVLMLHRGFHVYARQQREGVWQPQAQRRADAVQVGVLGQGQMGGEVSRRLRMLGYRVSGWRRGEPLGPVLASSEILVNLLPLTPHTRGLIDAAVLRQLPRGAALVNLARGAHVVDADLLAALDDGQLGHAVLDVFHQEPLPAGHRFWTHPAVTVLPHVAAQTDAHSAARIVAQNLAAWRRGEALVHQVDRRAGY
ncbi:glyoxylate/hydroxypyruvate reductase A [Sphaerotilus sp.]|uniref:2-hydroxyacid dehydrogenase n=1 Tax=Sphaerotilus sp. TaxID=2093942 RepID=UPI002ACE7686|nr:glyoxylate/hydroxypyruvate reductase A [Sphaerotilus sp.]MDZ7858854.1 glyoxylate/hydroxypyruvate reductase A [Sphaerotilus sp.]